MKQTRLVKFKESRRSQDGSVEVRAHTGEGETVQINFAPEVSEQVLWSILSTKGMTYVNDWKLWPLAPDRVNRAFHPDGTVELIFVKDGAAAFRVQIPPTLRAPLAQALTQETSSSTGSSEIH